LPLDERIVADFVNNDGPERVYFLSEMLAQLEIRERSVLVWTHLDGLKAEEISVRLGVSVRTVRRVLQSASKKIRKLL
jgi:RNA polymerase sigma factor (sigma-70 family)